MSSRGKNFTEKEKCKLIDLVQKYKHIVENKCTNAISTLKKNEAWQAITTEFNSNSEVPRTQKQLSTGYLNLKRGTRKSVACENVKKYLENKQASVTVYSEPGPSKVVTLIDESNVTNINITDENDMKLLLKQFKKDDSNDKKGVLATGGGTYTPVLSNIGAQMLAVMGDQITPLSNKCDSASNYFNQEETPIAADILLVDEGPSQSVEKSINKKPKSMKKIFKKKKKIKHDNNYLKTKYYGIKMQTALIEKKMQIVNYNISLNKQRIVDMELKIKETQYENIVHK